MHDVPASTPPAPSRPRLSSRPGLPASALLTRLAASLFLTRQATPLARLTLLTGALALLACLPASPALAFRLPATGVTKCYDANKTITCPEEGEPYYGQDGSYMKGAPMAYTDNGDGTVADQATGLVWQKVPETEAKTWEEAVTYCQNLILGGTGGWRLPSMRELSSLAAWAATSSPRLNPVFSDGHGQYWWDEYWSGDVLATDATKAWSLDFAAVTAKTPAKTGYKGVRCARGVGLKP